MLVDFQAVAPCDRSLNLLWDSYDVYYRDHEIHLEMNADEAPINRLAAALDDFAHEVWVPGYVTPADRQLIEHHANAVILHPRARLGRGGQEIVTAGVLDGLLERAEVQYREQEIEDGDRREIDRYREAMTYDDFCRLAGEAFLDGQFRMNAPTFELRVCPHDGRFFIPKRAGRGRFCRDACRNGFGARDEQFTCAFCGKRRPPRSYSGLMLAPAERNDLGIQYGDEREAPHDLRMSKFLPHYDEVRRHSRDLAQRYSNQSVCIDCVMEHRPAWGRYVFAADTVPQEALT